MTVRKFGALNRFFTRKTEKKPDMESTRGQVSTLVKEAGLPDTDRKMLDNVLSFSSTVSTFPVIKILPSITLDFTVNT